MQTHIRVRENKIGDLESCASWKIMRKMPYKSSNMEENTQKRNSSQNLCCAFVNSLFMMHLCVTDSVSSVLSSLTLIYCRMGCIIHCSHATRQMHLVSVDKRPENRNYFNEKLLNCFHVITYIMKRSSTICWKIGILNQ